MTDQELQISEATTNREQELYDLAQTSTEASLVNKEELAAFEDLATPAEFVEELPNSPESEEPEPVKEEPKPDSTEIGFVLDKVITPTEEE